MPMARVTDDDFEVVYDEDGKRREILKDRRTHRVSMMARDAAAKFLQQRSRPGFASARDAATRAVIDEAYADYEQDLTSAWQDAPGVGIASTAHAGDICTVRNAEYPNDFGAPGHYAERGGRLVCVPNNPVRSARPAPTSPNQRQAGAGSVTEATSDHARTMADTYAALDKELTEAWRNPA